MICPYNSYTVRYILFMKCDNHYLFPFYRHLLLIPTYNLLWRCSPRAFGISSLLSLPGHFLFIIFCITSWNSLNVGVDIVYGSSIALIWSLLSSLYSCANILPYNSSRKYSAHIVIISAIWYLIYSPSFYIPSHSYLIVLFLLSYVFVHASYIVAHVIIFNYFQFVFNSFRFIRSAYFYRLLVFFVVLIQVLMSSRLLSSQPNFLSRFSHIRR